MKNIVYFFIFCCLLPNCVQAATVEHRLNVGIGFFDAARVSMTYNLDKQSYEFASTVKTAGTFGKLYLFEALYSSEGIFKDGHTVTRDYRYETKSSSHLRTKQLVFDENGVLDHRLSSKDGKPKRVEITLPDTPFDASDLQTVFASVARQIIDNNFCAMEKTVFDGKKNYKVVFKDEGKETLKDEEIPYSGEALKCSVYIQSLDEEDDGDLLWNTTSDRPIYFWVLQDSESKLPFLAKIEIKSTPLGRLKAYTTEVFIKD